MTSIEGLETPCLLLDRGVLLGNIATMQDHARRLGLPLRPHLKTAKSAHLLPDLGPNVSSLQIAVSTLREAEVFFEAGVTDISYAVPLAVTKIKRARALAERGCAVSIFVDTVTAAEALVNEMATSAVSLAALIEIDADGYRGGVQVGSQAFLKIATLLARASGVRFEGLYSYAGRTYSASDMDEGRAIVAQSRESLLDGAEQLHMAQLPCEKLVIGGSPVATFAETLEGLTELCAGVFVFQDLFQAGLGVCRTDDIAVSVLSTVIGANMRTGKVFIDAGALALSQDRSTAAQSHDRGYGLLVEPSRGTVIEGYQVVAVSQEHGHILGVDGSSAVDRFPIGTKVRILPNHVCMTVNGHPGYHVITADGRVSSFWARFNGW